MSSNRHLKKPENKRKPWLFHSLEIVFPTQFLIQDTDNAVADPTVASNPFLAVCNFHKNRKTTCPKAKNEILNTCWKLYRTTMDNMFLSHSYMLIFLPKSLFSIPLILICITLSFVSSLGNHFSFHFIALRYKRNVMSFSSFLFVS